MSGTTVTVDDWDALCGENPDAAYDLLEWIEGVVGLMYVYEATLGEGVLEAEVTPKNATSTALASTVDPDLDQLPWERRTFPAPTPPPCWPAGMAS